MQVKGVELSGELPSCSEALESFKKFNLALKPLSFEQVWGRPASLVGFATSSLTRKDYLRDFVIGWHRGFKLPYPLVGSYSDIFVVSAKTVSKFSHLCGVFAATRLFVELALPTAMVLSALRIVTEKDLGLIGRALWTPNDLKVLDQFEYKLGILLKDFPKNHLYLHPVKLSKWEVEF